MLHLAVNLCKFSQLLLESFIRLKEANSTETGSSKTVILAPLKIPRGITCQIECKKTAGERCPSLHSVSPNIDREISYLDRKHPV
jgi:hypothetical protein